MKKVKNVSLKYFRNNQNYYPWCNSRRKILDIEFVGDTFNSRRLPKRYLTSTMVWVRKYLTFFIGSRNFLNCKIGYFFMWNYSNWIWREGEVHRSLVKWVVMSGTSCYKELLSWRSVGVECYCDFSTHVDITVPYLRK